MDERRRPAVREDRTDGVGGGDTDRERWNAHVGVGGGARALVGGTTTRARWEESR